MRRPYAGLAILALTLGLTACDSGPECVESHVETRVQSRTTYINGKPHTRPEVVAYTVCDKYEEKK